MSRNASGTYTAPVNSFNPAVAGTAIDEDDWNAQLADYIAAFTDSLSRTAQGGMLADLGMGGFSIGAVGSFTTPVATLTLANGANSNITLGTGSFFRVSGPTGAFSLSGLTGGANGRRITIYNPIAQNFTITNDATSTAANRFLTLTGADVVSTGVCAYSFIYDSTDTRWILLASNL